MPRTTYAKAENDNLTGSIKEVKPRYLSSDVQLIGFRAFSRGCDQCGDLADPALRVPLRAR